MTSIGTNELNSRLQITDQVGPAVSDGGCIATDATVAFLAVYATFRARIRSIDRAKKAELRRAILADIVAHSPQEQLDDKLERLTEQLTLNADLPLPSDDQQQWWIKPGECGPKQLRI